MTEDKFPRVDTLLPLTSLTSLTSKAIDQATWTRSYAPLASIQPASLVRSHLPFCRFLSPQARGHESWLSGSYRELVRSRNIFRACASTGKLIESSVLSLISQVARRDPIIGVPGDRFARQALNLSP